MAWLKQSTAVTIRLGPALDKTDGVTEETALSPTVEVSKNHGAFAARNSVTAITHDSNGWYAVELNATDTGTLGPLIAKFDDAATHLPVWREFMVVPANVYDGLVGATDVLQVDVSQWKDATAPAMTGDAFARLGAPAGASVSADIASVQSDTNDIQTRLPAALTAGGNIKADALVVSDKTGYALTQSFPANFADLAITVTTGRVTVGTNADKTGYSLAADQSAVTVGTVNALGAQAKLDVNAEADTALVDARLDELLTADSDIDGLAPPTVGSVFHELMSKTAGSFTYDQTTDSLEAVRDRGDAAWVTATGFSTLDAAGVRTAVGLAAANLDTQLAALPSAAANADAVWDEARAGHVAAGSFGEGVASVQGAVTGAVASVTAGVTVTTNNDKTGYSIGTGGIAAAAFAAGAIDSAAVAADAIGASELAADAATEIADALLNRNIASGSSTGRTVKQALYALRNRCAIAAGTLTVYQIDDVTAEWTAAVTTAAGNPVSEIDPA